GVRPRGAGRSWRTASAARLKSLACGEDATPTGCLTSVYATDRGTWQMGASRSTSGPFAVKDHSRLIKDTESGSEEGGLKRAVGARDLTALGVGAVIGTGIFVIIGEGIGDAGPAVILSFILAAVTC